MTVFESRPCQQSTVQARFHLSHSLNFSSPPSVRIWSCILSHKLWLITSRDRIRCHFQVDVFLSAHFTVCFTFYTVQAPNKKLWNKGQNPLLDSKSKNGRKGLDESLICIRFANLSKNGGVPYLEFSLYFTLKSSFSVFRPKTIVPWYFPGLSM